VLPAADVQNGTFGAKRGGNAGDRVRESRPGGRDHTAELARLARIAVGGMCRHLLVPHVDDADAFIHTAVIDIDDVAAAQREDRIDALVFERLCHQVSAGDHTRIAAFALQRVFCGRRLPLRGFRSGANHMCLRSLYE